MVTIRGASQFLNQATLTNTRGVAAQATTVLGEAAGGVGILDIGRNLASPGIGISNNARALNRQFLSSTSGTYNALFSASGGGSATVDASLTQIRGLQATVPASRDTPQVREAAQDAQATAETLQDLARGDIVDETV